MWPAYFIFKETILKAAELVSACKHAIEKGSLMRARERQTEGEHAQQESVSVVSLEGSCGLTYKEV